jgi:hypothetical protein
MVHNIKPHNGYSSCNEPFNEKAPMMIEDLLPWGTMGEMKIPGERENLKDESETVHRVGCDLSPPGDCYIVQKISDTEVVATCDVKWATKYRFGKADRAIRSCDGGCHNKRGRRATTTRS